MVIKVFREEGGDHSNRRTRSAIHELVTAHFENKNGSLWLTTSCVRIHVFHMFNRRLADVPHEKGLLVSRFQDFMNERRRRALSLRACYADHCCAAGGGFFEKNLCGVGEDCRLQIADCKNTRRNSGGFDNDVKTIQIMEIAFAELDFAICNLQFVIFICNRNLRLRRIFFQRLHRCLALLAVAEDADRFAVKIL